MPRLTQSAKVLVLTAPGEGREVLQTGTDTMSVLIIATNIAWAGWCPWSHKHHVGSDSYQGHPCKDCMLSHADCSLDCVPQGWKSLLHLCQTPLPCSIYEAACSGSVNKLRFWLSDFCICFCSPSEMMSLMILLYPQEERDNLLLW